MMALASRRLIVRLLVGVLASTQLAIVAYACAGLSRMSMAARDRPASLAMAMARLDQADDIGSDPGAAWIQGGSMSVGCGPLDPAMPNLCLAHCQYGQQSADHNPAPTVPAALLTSFYPLPPLAEASSPSALVRGPDAAPAGADPPHAVLHCCLRL